MSATTAATDKAALSAKNAPTTETSATAGDLLARARSQWQLGDWAALASLTKQSLNTHPERGRLALMAATGCAQVGDMDTARSLATQALDWGCEREFVARVLIGGVYNSLGRVASLLGDDPRAAQYFEASVTVVSPREDTKLLGRARHIHEKTRLGQLPEAAAMIRDDQAGLTAKGTPKQAQIDMLQVQVDLLNHVLTLAIQRGQLTLRADKQGENGEESLYDRLRAVSPSQLGQDVWVLEQTGLKRGGFFVEFGATDGVTLSNTFLLERDFGWTGICAEPNPDFHSKLVKNRSCQISDALIFGRTGEEVKFVLAAEYGGAVQHLDLDQHADKRQPFLDAGKTLTLTSVSLDDFLTAHNAPREIDYLSIDTEGSEYEILSQFPFDKWRIGFLTVEHNYSENRARIRDLLVGHGYEVTEAEWDDWYALAS